MFVPLQVTTAQSLAWAQRAGGDSHDTVRGFAVDARGAGVLGGVFIGTATFGEGTTREQTFTALQADGFIAKYNRGGQFYWAQHIRNDDGHTTAVQSVTTDLSENVFVVGLFFGRNVLAPGQPEETMIGSENSGGLFVAKYNRYGRLVWVAVGHTVNEMYPYSISVHPSDGVSVGGFMSGDVLLGEGEANEAVVSNAGGFLFNFDADTGHYNWASIVEWEMYNGLSEVQDVVLDSLGNTYTTGYLSGTVYFGKGEANETKVVADGIAFIGTDAFLAKYDNAGLFQWVKVWNGTGNQYGQDIEIVHANEVVVIGDFHDEIIFESGNVNELSFEAEGLRSSFVTKYDADGELHWVSLMDADQNESTATTGLTWHEEEGIMVVGGFNDSVTLGSGTQEEVYLAVQDPHKTGQYIAVFDEHGKLINSSAMYSSAGVAFAPAIDDHGNWLFGGTFTGDLEVSIDGEDGIVLQSEGKSDLFIAQFREGESRRDKARADMSGASRDMLQPSTAVPEAFALESNYPNPFNPETTIRYALPEDVSGIRLAVFDLMGQRVRTLASGSKSAGYHEVSWDGRDEAGRQVASGVYLYRLEAGDFLQSRTMTLIK